ncbi:MAG: cellulase family glycosylhydrolase [Dysgonamonadaceae bacterium]|nr:cellulase family glycosylhydrolase [Dysgonamonadaceae bacterium]
MKKILFALASIASLTLLASCSGRSEFVTVHSARFQVNGKPYSFIGANLWYGAILASTGQGGNRERLQQELDLMQQLGIDNLRILVGADGLEGQVVKIRPTLQQQPSVYNDTIFDGLDYLLAEMGKRRMYAVLYLNNSWEWSGGYGQYLEWAGQGRAPEFGVQDWTAFQQQMSKYAGCDSCHALFFRHVKNVISRTNRYTGKKYADDPAIMAWQVGNEPRVFSEGDKTAFVKWLREATALIRSLDCNHLISTGNEGFMGSEMDWDLVTGINADPNVDYITIHIWPKNWSWVRSGSLVQDVDTAIVRTNEYIWQHLRLAEKMHKPLVIEEFGYPRDKHLFTPTDATTARDRYYENIFMQVVSATAPEGREHPEAALAGCNFWTWGGYGRPAHLYWQTGDDYLGDPAQEEQGLNSVFDTDSTLTLIRRYNEKRRCGANK